MKCWVYRTRCLPEFRILLHHQVLAPLLSPIFERLVLLNVFCIDLYPIFSTSPTNFLVSTSTRMAPSSTEILGTSHKAIGPEELAIIGLMEAIFNLADNGSAFVRRLQTSFKVAGVFKDLSQLRPAEVQVSWLVGFIRENVKKEAIRSADAERRRSVSTIVEVCTFQLKHLTSRIFVGEKTSLSHSTSLLSILGKTREIRNRVNFLSVQTQDLTQLLEYLNKVRPSPSRPMSVPNPPISMIPRVACNDFVGREDTLKSLLTQLPQARQVILGGISGIG